MAQFLRSKLHALSSSCLPPPALVSKLLKSPDLRLGSQRWLAEDALLEDQGISWTETDGCSDGVASLQNFPCQSTNKQNMKDTRWHDLSNDSFLKKKGNISSDSSSQKGDDIKAKGRQHDKESSLHGRPGLLKASRPEHTNLENSNRIRNKDMLPLITKDQEYSFTRASEDRDLQDIDHVAIKNNAQETPFSQTPRALDSPFKHDTSHQALNNTNCVSKQSFMVCVQNLPPSSNPSMIKASMAVHGEVVGLFKKTIHDRLNVYIQFKTAVGMENALASRLLPIGSKKCHIVRVDDSSVTTVVRVSKVANETHEQEVWAVCEQFGKVDDVKKRAYGLFDVYYNTKELSNIPSILYSLSEVTINQSTWLALPAPLLHPSVQKELLNRPEGQSWVGIQVNRAIYRIEAGLDILSVLFQDLKHQNNVVRDYSK